MRAVGLVTLLLVAVVAVTAPRFDQRDIGPLASLTGTESDGNLGDAAQYIRYVEVIRGEAETLPPAPFRYRPLAPLLAAPLPFEPMTAINVVNVAALTAGALALFVMLRRLGTADRAALAGSLLFVVSFPTFYYGAIGYVDPLAIAVVVATLAAVVADRRAIALVLLVLAALAREATLIVIPAALAWAWASWGSHRAVGKWAAVWLGAFLAVTAAVRVGLQAPGTNVWEPSIEVLRANVTRPRTWLSAALTLGVPAVVVLVYRRQLARLGRPERWMLGTGAIVCLALFGYALVAAYADGRFLWPIYAFSVPAAVLAYGASRPEPSGPRPTARSGRLPHDEPSADPTSARRD